MQISSLKIPDIKLVSCKRFGDDRGFFAERFRQDTFAEAGIQENFCQENFSRSAYNVLRGLHFQFDPPQGKLVTCMAGKVLDVAVDIRVNSPTFGDHIVHELDGSKPEWLWIPAGFAHGFYVMSKEGADLYYKVNNYYRPAGELGLAWNDKKLNIGWPTDTPVLSTKDMTGLSLDDYKKNPKF